FGLGQCLRRHHNDALARVQPPPPYLWRPLGTTGTLVSANERGGPRVTRTPESIRAEADRIKARSVELKAALAADPGNAGIRQELAALKAQFDALGAAYRNAKAAAP